MKITYKFFQKYIANFIIIACICFIGVISYQGGVLGVFSSSNQGEIIYAGNVKNNAVSLMFNVYMGNEHVESILNMLEKHNVKATFFVGGTWVNKNEECFKKIVESGNEIGNHGYWHKDHSKISDEQQFNEIKMTDEIVKTISGISMTLFAPPSGAYNSKTANIANSLGYKTIMWTKDTIDWRDNDKTLVFNRAVNNVKAGDLILCHPTEVTASVLEKIIQKYKEIGLKITTVGQNII